MGSVLSLIRGVHCAAKYLLNSLAFSLQSNTNLLLARIGGILGALHLFSTLVIIFQYDFGGVFGSLSLSPSRLR